jgi:hypothetical protein
MTTVFPSIFMCSSMVLQRAPIWLPAARGKPRTEAPICGMLAAPTKRGRVSGRIKMAVSRHFDQVAIVLSTICIVHCLAVPVIVAVLPVAAVSFGDDAHFHGLMLWLVVPTSVAGFGLGYRVHRRAGIVLAGAAGVLALIAAATWGHTAWSDAAEVAGSLAGSTVLAIAHWMNFREVRRRHRHA